MTKSAQLSAFEQIHKFQWYVNYI